MKIVSLAELDQIEKTIAQHHKRQSNDLINKFPPQEKVLLCVYEPSSSGAFIPKPDLTFFVLTNLRLLYTFSSFAAVNVVEEVSLTKLTHADLTGIFSLKGIHIYYPDRQYISVNFTFKKADWELGEVMVAEINKAISQSKGHVMAPTVNVTIAAPEQQNESIAEQLRKISELHKSGVLTDDEFTRAKQRIIG